MRADDNGGPGSAGPGGDPQPRLSRRTFLQVGVGGAAAALAGYWAKARFGPAMRSEVFIAKAARYDDELSAVILSGLRELGIGPAQVEGRRILLKPNLVEAHSPTGHVNSHPLVVRGVVEAFRRLGAARVLVADADGHRRDSVLVLDESGLGEVLREDRIPYVDLN
jgi:hypothetical protein